MSKSRNSLLYKSAAGIVFLVFMFWGAIQAKSFLAPLLVAFILMLLILPMARRFEQWGLSKSLASLAGTLSLFIISLGFFTLVSAQIKNVVDKWDTIQETMEPKIEKATKFIVKTTPVTEEKLEGYKQNLNNFKIIATSDNRSGALAYVSGLVSFMGTYLLVFIYVFFLLRFRYKFKLFILKFFSENNDGEVKQIIHKIAKVAQGYLLGKLKLIGLLAVLYSIGLGISGVSNFILVALLAAVLTIIPYLGNVLGYCLAIIFGYLVNGEMGVLVGITSTFVLTQFIESYILQPYIVGDEIDLNPFFVILAVILGNLLWGIIGMVVAIPVLGILNVIFLHVPSLKPFGYLFGKNKND